MGQQTFAFKLDGANPKKVQLGVGDEPARIRIVLVSSSPFSTDSGVWGWFGRELTKAEADPMVGAGSATGDPEVIAGNLAPSAWFDVPPGTAFLTLHTLAGARGMVIMEAGPCRCDRCGGR